MKYTVKKITTTILTLLMVSFLLFLAFELIPGDPAVSKLGIDATPESIAKLRAELGLDRPFFERYFTWIISFFKGDWGNSYSYSSSVSEMILNKLPITFTLTLLSFAMIVVISLPLGLYTAKHHGGVIDSVIYTINQVIMAIPSFFSGILITILFGVLLKFYVPGNFVSYEVDFGAFIQYLIYPAIAIALPKIAMTTKMLRSSLVAEMRHDYTRTAYSRGNNTSQVLYKHVLKNGLIPVLTFLGMTLADIVTGSIIIEQVFNIPGLGRILLSSISNRDYPVVEAIMMLMAFLIVMINLMVDLVYKKIDPRITME